jgi:hypothetical protein
MASSNDDAADPETILFAATRIFVVSRNVLTAVGSRADTRCHEG